MMGINNTEEEENLQAVKIKKKKIDIEDQSHKTKSKNYLN